MDTDPQIGSDFILIIHIFWIRESKPLMHQHMILLKVDLSNIEFKMANSVVLEISFVQDTNHDLSLLYVIFLLLRLYIIINPYKLLGFKEVMLSPVDLLGWPHILFALAVLLLSETHNLNHWINSRTKQDIVYQVVNSYL